MLHEIVHDLKGIIGGIQVPQDTEEVYEFVIEADCRNFGLGVE